MSSRENIVRVLQQNAHVLLAVFYHQSITKAADELGRSQGAVSQVLKHVEDALEVELFDRSTRPWQLTPMEFALFRDLRQTQARLSETVHNLRRNNNLPNEVRIGVIESVNRVIGSDLILESLKVFRRVVAMSSPSDMLLTELKRGTVDWIIVSNAYPNEPNLIRRRLFTEKNALIYPAEVIPRPVERVEDLMFSGLPVIRTPLHASAGALIEGLYTSSAGIFANRCEVESIDTLIKLVAGGHGWTIQQPICALACPEVASKLKITTCAGALGARDVYLIGRSGLALGVFESVATVILELVKTKIVEALKKYFPEVSTAISFV